jgi:hypothetical protein
MKNATAAVVTTVALSGWAFAQAKPDFSGTWTETGAAAGKTAQVMIVQQDAASLTVRVPSIPDPWVLKLDGSESKNTTTQTDGRVIASVSTAKWDGDKLVIATPGRSNGDGPFVVTLTWTLREADKLVVKETIVTQGGTTLRDLTRTYSR